MGYIGTKMTGHQYRSSKVDKVIIGIGSFENHGDHMPFGTDALISNMLAERVAEQVEGLMVLPPVNYGFSAHYNQFPFVVSLSAETITRVIKEILLEIIRNGVTRIVIMNGHDGNIAPIELAAREVKVMHPEAVIASLNDWWVAAGKIVPKDTFEVWDGLGHAGEGETSMGLALFPELMQMEHARGVVPVMPEHVDVKWCFNELTDTGATGDPSVGTVAKGKLMEKAVVDVLVNFIKEMDRNDWKIGMALK